MNADNRLTRLEADLASALREVLREIEPLRRSIAELKMDLSDQKRLHQELAGAFYNYKKRFERR